MAQQFTPTMHKTQKVFIYETAVVKEKKELAKVSKKRKSLQRAYENARILNKNISNEPISARDAQGIAPVKPVS
jgi:hypothetical protein